MDAREGIRREKARDLVSYISSHVDSSKAVNVGQTAFDSAINSFSKAFFSFDMADPDSSLCREFKKTMWELMFEAARPNLADLFPVMRRMDPQGIRRRMEGHFMKLFELFDGIVRKRVEEREEGLPERGDVLDGLLQICREKSEDFEFEQIPRLLLVTDFYLS